MNPLIVWIENRRMIVGYKISLYEFFSLIITRWAARRTFERVSFDFDRSISIDYFFNLSRLDDAEGNGEVCTYYLFGCLARWLLWRWYNTWGSLKSSQSRGQGCSRLFLSFSLSLLLQARAPRSFRFRNRFKTHIAIKLDELPSYEISVFLYFSLCTWTVLWEFSLCENRFRTARTT